MEGKSALAEAWQDRRVLCVSGDWEGVGRGRTEGVYVRKERKRYGGKQRGPACRALNAY